ncbi:MAG TPA: carboxypeptidase regulatory-like domain-containing protein, partial [Candidatus Hydrogenedentes bacterium]|nr:carboxypeptidase regulatory-like domain-containing protein [Candidatus Hydrogenedentota bacterium]
FDGLAAGDYALWAAIARDAMINEILGGGGMALTPENVNDTLTRWGAKAPVTRIALGRSEDVNGLVVRRLGNQSIHISGRVVDTQGTPIDNFTFGARGPMDATDDEYDPSRWYEFNDLLVRDARTDAAGRFRISGLRKGAYAITADRPGFERVRLTGVRAGAEDLEIVLSRIGEIEGRVVDAVTGRAVRQFVLTTKHPDQDVQPSQAVREAKSINYAEDGRFRMASRSNGATRLWVFADGYAAKNMLLHVVSEEVLGGVIVRLEPLAGVSGRVIDAAGNPVSGAAIFVGAVPADHGVFFSYRAVARSQSDGSFQIPYEGMTPGLISAIHPGYARAAVSVELNRTEPAHVELVLDPGGTVEGIVTASRGLVVLLRVPGDEGVGLLRTETDAGGRYRFEHVPPGLVEVILVEGWNNKYQCEAVVASAETTVVDFEVHDGACVLSGAVTTRGEPVDRGRIFVSTTVDEATNTRVATIEEGQYFIEDLPSGQAHVRVFSDRDPSAGMKEAWVDLDPDQETVLNADFSGSGTLVGHVAGHGEEEQVAVLALPGKGDVGDVALTDPDRILEPRLARTDPEGAFRIHPMEPGTYTVFVRAFDREPAFSEGRFSQYTKQAVAVVEILDGTPCEVALTLR